MAIELLPVRHPRHDARPRAHLSGCASRRAASRRRRGHRLVAGVATGPEDADGADPDRGLRRRELRRVDRPDVDAVVPLSEVRDESRRRRFQQHVLSADRVGTGRHQRWRAGGSARPAPPRRADDDAGDRVDGGSAVHFHHRMDAVGADSRSCPGGIRLLQRACTMRTSGRRCTMSCRRGCARRPSA